MFKTVVIIAVIIWNIITFAMYGADKKKAKNKQWRTKESTLIAVAFIMGGIGAYAGMKYFRHKTKHIKFQILVPIAIIINIICFVLIFK